jgi:hypothetical protein
MPGPSTTRLLDALDSVLNSNTFLLEDTVSADADTAALLAEFFSSGRFRELLAQADAERGWHNYAAPDDSEALDPTTTLDDRLYVGRGALSLAELDRSSLRDELRSLLTTPQSPHHQQLTASDADALVDAFLSEVGVSSASDSWQFFRVAPDFLRSTGYATPEGAHAATAPAYFDGGPFDRCLVLRHGPSLRVLLTNGAP